MKLKKIDLSRFGTRLKELRTEKYRTMDDFCTRFSDVTGCRINHSTVSRWESGQSEPVMSSLLLLADFFCVSPDYLIGRNCDKLGFPADTRTKAEVLADTLDKDEFEAVRLFARLDVKGRTKALSLLYELAGES